MAATAELLYNPVDAIPVLADVRDAAREQAFAIIENNRELLRSADYEAVPLPVDALGSAVAVREAQSTYGEQSDEARERYAGLRLDCQRLLAEAARKNTYEYFPPLLQKFDAEKGEYFSHGFSILAMTEAGLTPVAEPEELERRVNERVEEATYQAIGRLAVLGHALSPDSEAPKPRRIRTISECPDWAIDAYERKSKGGYGGYVPEIQKFMIRDVVFDPITGDRYEEQVGVPGKKINGKTIRSVLEARGIANAAELSKTELQALQLEVDDDPLSFVAQLDIAATTMHETAVFMGEAVSVPGNYAAVAFAAEHRQAALEDKAADLAGSILGLTDAGIDRWAANGIVAQQVKDILFEIATNDTSQAENMFDQNTARGLQEVQYLRMIGNFEQADSRLEAVEAQAPAPSYCGAGSCGLEKVGTGSDKASAMKEMGLDASKSLKDTERRCPRCSKKEIVYDLKNKVKACTGCKSKTGFGKSSK